MATTKTREPAALEDIQQKIAPKDIDLNQYIPVRNGFPGILVYKSARTGERFEWERFGDTQDIELRELRNAKSNQKAFFINNWFMFDAEFDWVIDYLGMRQYYKNTVSIDNFDDVFKKSPAQAKKIISEMSEGQKRSLAYRAHEMIAAGELDSLKLIATLEEGLGVDLVEK